MKKIILISIFTLIFSISLNASNFNTIKKIEKEYSLEQVNYNALKPFLNMHDNSLNADIEVKEINIILFINKLNENINMKIIINPKEDFNLMYNLKSISFTKDKENNFIISSFEKNKIAMQVYVKKDNIAIRTFHGLFVNENNLLKMKDRDFSESYFSETK
jgi:phosphotransferase system IIB component